MPTSSDSNLESQYGVEAYEASGDAQEKGTGDAINSNTTGEKPGEAEEDHEYITGFKLIAVLGSVTLAAFLMLLDGSIIGTALPSITSEFHSLADVGWYVAAYQLASAALQPLTGKMYTQYSCKWTYLAFFLLFEVGSLICGLSNSSSMLIAGRTIAGLGSSGLLNGGITIIAGAIPLDKRPLYIGIYLGIIQLGTVVGPLIGGALTEYASWRWCFYINLPVGGVAGILLLWIKIPDLTVKPPFTISLLRETIPKLDLRGFALFTPASTMFLLALQFGGNAYPWNSSVVIGLFCGSGAAVILFLLWEKRVGDQAMIPFSVAGKRIVYCSALNGAALVVAILVASQYLPIYFQGVLNYEPAMSGVNLLPTIISQLLMVILSGVLIQKLGYYLPFAIAGSAISSVGNGLVSMISPSTKTAMWIGYEIVLGIGRGIGMQKGVVAVQNALPAHQIPIGIAFTIFCQNLAGAIFVVASNVVFSQALTSEIRAHAPSVSLEAAFAAGASPSAIRALVPTGSREIEGVLLAFSNSIDKVFYLLVACCGGGLLASLGMGWVDTRK